MVFQSTFQNEPYSVLTTTNLCKMISLPLPSHPKKLKVAPKMNMFINSSPPPQDHSICKAKLRSECQYSTAQHSQEFVTVSSIFVHLLAIKKSTYAHYISVTLYQNLKSVHINHHYIITPLDPQENSTAPKG